MLPSTNKTHLTLLEAIDIIIEIAKKNTCNKNNQLGILTIKKCFQIRYKMHGSNGNLAHLKPTWL
jgi:hypothetical protein